MKQTERIKWIFALLAVAALAAVAAIFLVPMNRSIPSSGGAAMSVNQWRAEPYYLQRDARWKHDTVGGSEEELSAVGCTLCCVSMAFTHLGVKMDPKELNAYLKTHNCYDEKGRLLWGQTAAMFKGKIEFEILRNPSYGSIDAAVSAGQFVVAKVMLHGTAAHWVLIVGKEGKEYLVKNPLNEKLDPEKLSALSDNIESIRIVKPAVSGT